MTEIGTGDGRFEPTCWSLVRRATADDDSQGAREALASLLDRYWRPVYHFVRRRGHDAESAKDLTQGFVAHLLAGSGLAGVDRARGTFRSYLLGALSHFLANHARDSKRLKRGGGRPQLSLDFQGAESEYRIEPADRGTPESAFLRRWAEETLARALAGVAADMEASGRRVYYEVLVRTVGPRASSYADIAAELGIGVSDVGNYLRRARRRLRERLIEELLPGVADPAQVDEEIRDLFDALEGER